MTIIIIVIIIVMVIIIIIIKYSARQRFPQLLPTCHISALFCFVHFIIISSLHL